MMLRGWGAVGLGLIAVVAGLVLLAFSTQTPLLRDADAFDAAVSGLHAQAHETGDFRQASRHFHPLRDLHATPVGILVDAGSSLVAGGALLASFGWGAAQFAGFRRALFQTHRFGVVVLVSLLVAIGFSGGAMLQAITIFERREVPPWADSLGIPMAASVAMAPVVFVFLLVIAGAPLLRRKLAGESFWIRPSGNVLGVIALVIYGALALALLFIAVLSAVQPAGFIVMPSALMACWLMVHARAVASA